jgi:vacuolar-type H+-ATPase subunit I/STV1
MKMKVSLPPKLKRRIQRQVDVGLYEDAADVVRTALRVFLDEDGPHGSTRPGISGMDVSEAAFIIMMSATKDMDDDVRLIMAEIKAMTAAKADLRERIKDLNEWIVDEMTRHESSRNIRNETIDSEPQHGVQCRPGGQVAEILKSIADGLQDNLDSMNELSEMTSLRLQNLMDRRSRYIETLSNIMKKVASTQDALAQNLK